MKEDFFVVCLQSIYFLTVAIECANEIRATVDYQMYAVDYSNGWLIRS